MQFKFCHTLCVHKYGAPGETSLLKSVRDSPGAGIGQEPAVQLALQFSPALKDRICFGEEWEPRWEEDANQSEHKLCRSGKKQEDQTDVTLKSQFSLVVFNRLL